MALLKRINVDGEEVDIEDLTDSVLTTQFINAEAGIVALALGGKDKNWLDRSFRISAEAKFKSLQNEVRRRKLVIE